MSFSTSCVANTQPTSIWLSAVRGLKGAPETLAQLQCIPANEVCVKGDPHGRGWGCAFWKLQIAARGWDRGLPALDRLAGWSPTPPSQARGSHGLTPLIFRENRADMHSG